MAKSINEIMGNLGISGSSGSFDYERDIEEKDTRKLTKGGKDSAPADPRIGTEFPTSAERNLERAREAGLAPPAAADPKMLNLSIYTSEASPEDQKNPEQMTAYFEKSTGTYNIGPGLNLDSPLVSKALLKRGIDAGALKDLYDFKSKQPIDPELVPIMREVFNDVVDGARKDARTFVEIDTWNKLKPHEKDAISDMSYNLGLAKLGGFKNMKTAIQALVNQRSPEMVSVVLAQMEDSNWYNQVGQRALKVMNTFSSGQDEASQRYLRGLNA